MPCHFSSTEALIEAILRKRTAREDETPSDYAPSTSTAIKQPERKTMKLDPTPSGVAMDSGVAMASGIPTSSEIATSSKVPTSPEVPTSSVGSEISDESDSDDPEDVEALQQYLESLKIEIAAKRAEGIRRKAAHETEMAEKRQRLAEINKSKEQKRREHAEKLAQLHAQNMALGQNLNRKRFEEMKLQSDLRFQNVLSTVYEKQEELKRTGYHANVPQNRVCELCLQPFSHELENTPRNLLCGHSFCLGCIRRLRQHTPNQIRCPYEDLYTPWTQPLEKLPKNFGILQMCGL